MAIVFWCGNGHQLVVDDSLGGRKVMCPTCRAIVETPAIAPETFHIPVCTLAEGAPVSPAKLAELRAQFRREPDLPASVAPPSPSSLPAKPAASPTAKPAPPKPTAVPADTHTKPATAKPPSKVNAPTPVPIPVPAPVQTSASAVKLSSKASSAVPSPPAKPPPNAPAAKTPSTVTFDGVTYPTTESHEGFCKGIAIGMARAIMITLSDYGHHRTAIARRYANQFGESMDASLAILRAPLGCARCGKRMSDRFTRSLAATLATSDAADAGNVHSAEPPRCEVCGSKTAYLLFEPSHDFDSKPQTPEQRPDPNESFLKAKRFKRSTRQQLLRIQLGITLHEIRIVLYLALILAVLVAILSIVVLQPRPLTAERITILTVATVVIGTIFGRLLGIGGSALCCFAPQKLKGLVRILSSLALDALSLTFTIAHAIVAMIHSRQDQFEPDDDVNNVLNFLTNLSGVAAWVMFMLFLVRLGIFLRQWGAVEQARNLIYWGFILIGSPIAVLTAVRYIVPLCDVLAVQIILAALCVLAFIWLILWCKLMFATIDMFRMFRAAIAKAVAESTN